MIFYLMANAHRMHLRCGESQLWRQRS